MKMSQVNNPTKLKYFAASYFILIGVLNLLDTFFSNIDITYSIRDFIILFVLSLPLLINKRPFYFIFGLITSTISFLTLILYVDSQNLSKAYDSIWAFLPGFVIICLGFLCSLALIYIGIYTAEKNRFKLI